MLLSFTRDDCVATYLLDPKLQAHVGVRSAHGGHEHLTHPSKYFFDDLSHFDINTYPHHHAGNRHTSLCVYASLRKVNLTLQIDPTGLSNHLTQYVKAPSSNLHNQESFT